LFAIHQLEHCYALAYQTSSSARTEESENRRTVSYSSLVEQLLAEPQ